MQSQFRASSLSATQTDAPRRTRRGSLSKSLSQFFPNLTLWLCKWQGVFRSFRAHIRIQFATETGWVDLGPAFRAQAGRYLPNERTRARALGTKNLLATCPWADRADLHTFLKGFEAAEEFYKDRHVCSADSPESQHIPS